MDVNLKRRHITAKQKMPFGQWGSSEDWTVRTLHGTTDGFKSGKGVRQGCILSLCLFNLSAGYIMRNAGLDESPAGIKIAGRNINNLRYADNATLMAESEEELKSLLMRVKEESGKNSTFKLNSNWLRTRHSKNWDHDTIASWQVQKENVEAVT